MKTKYIILVLLVIVAGIVVWVYNSKSTTLTSNNPKPMENQTGNFVSSTKTYSFSYPIFDKWDVKVANNEISYSPSANSGFNSYTPFKITMQEKMLKVAADFWDKQPKNSKGVPYIPGTVRDSLGNTTLTFKTASGSMELSIPKAGESYGFSGQKVWDTVLNSFESK